MPTTPPPNRLIRSDEVFRRTGYKRTSIMRFIKAGTFPAPVRDGGALLFSESTVQDWIDRRLMAGEVSK
jgi:predicted DNA-binding transcriptional regulator AlpA